MSLNPNEQNVVGYDEPDAPTLPDRQPGSSESAQVDGDTENREDSCSLGGTDWSMYVNYIYRTPERASNPNLAARYAGSIPEVENEVEVPMVLSVPNLQPPSQATDNSVDQLALGDPETHVSSSTTPRDVPYSIPNPRLTSETIAGHGVVSDAALADPIDISTYFYGVTSRLVRYRISRARYLSLREHINHRIVEALGNPDMAPKSARSDH